MPEVCICVTTREYVLQGWKVDILPIGGVYPVYTLSTGSISVLYHSKLYNSVYNFT